jgi:hypothetical protein
MSKYVAEFRVENLETEESRQAEESSSIVTKERKIDAKVVGKTLATGVAVTLVASRLYAQYEGTRNAIVGDSVAQRVLDNRMAYLNEGLSALGSVGIAALINPVTAVAAAGALAVSYGMRGYQTALQNQVKQASWTVESVVNAQKQLRLVKDITGVRI